jgi:hypothetical protein
MVFVLGTMMSGTASGNWKHYCMMSEHIHNINLFLNNFIKMVNTLLSLSAESEFRMLGCQILGNLLHLKIFKV